MSRKPLTEKLRRFGSQINSPRPSPPDIKLPDRYQLLAETVDGELIAGSAGCYCLIRTHYPIGFNHGAFTLEADIIEKSVPAAAFSPFENTLELPLSSMIFVDTETTGLGGSGAVAFLIGAGRVTHQGFEVLQYLIPDYSDEAAMLEDFHQNLSIGSTIVSFNGASFDLPVLQDRMIINRVARKLDYEYHLDLLHSARRLFKRRLQDCTLTNLERRLFSFYRTDDIPGHLVPSVYFEWLSAQELSRMKAVLEHNRYDIVSLYFLTNLISEAYQSEGGSLEHPEDLHSLSRFYERRRENNRIEKVYNRVQQFGNGISPDAALHYARSFKRSQNLQESVKIWETLVTEKSSQSFWACIELAKYYEHQVKDFKNALEYAKLASHCDCISDKLLETLNKRVERLAKKLNSNDEN